MAEKSKILVTGGAGYIGSHMAKQLARARKDFVVLDNLDRGHERAVKWSPLVKADLGDRGALKKAMSEHRINAVIHFAAHSCVGESVQNPALYFRNNVMNTMILLEVMQELGIKCIVFSSTAAVYGNPQTIPIPEEHPKAPVNPYGETKIFIEKALAWHEKAYGLQWMALRYFNAAGADPEGEIGEDHSPETHLIPIVLEAVLGNRPHVEIYGTDYETPDGTAIRDYIHVTDLADAHVKALEYLKSGGKSGALNLGTGQGYSVREVIQMAEKVTGKKVPVREASRRAGDPPALVAKVENAKKILNWKPVHSDLKTIVQTAWQWHQKHESI